MKKLLFLFLSVLVIGSIFQACDNSKTYAEMLEDEKNAVNQFIRDSAITVISEDQFRENGYRTDLNKNEYVAFSTNGVYMQIRDIGSVEETDTFANNNIITVRYLEKNVATRELTCFNVFLEEFADLSELYTDPGVFRYVDNGSSSSYGIFLEDGMDYYWASTYGTTAVPAGWLLALPYIRNGAHVRLIVPSKMGHSSAQQYVTPFYYDIRDLSKAKS